MKFNIDFSMVLGIIMAVAFLVNIIVQMTKSYIPLPTKLWCILVSVSVVVAVLFAAISFHVAKLNAGTVILSLMGSFIVAFIAMYGFDTFKELWQRFKEGDDINE